jgi:hypothetical protein
MSKDAEIKQNRFTNVDDEDGTLILDRGLQAAAADENTSIGAR